MEGRKIEDVGVLRELVQLFGWAETGNGRWIYEHGDMSKNVTWDEVVATESRRIAKFVDIWEAATTGTSFPVVARAVLGEPCGSRRIPSEPDKSDRTEGTELPDELRSLICMLDSRLSRLERGEVGKPKCTCDDPGDSPCPVHHRENQLQDRAIKAENELKQVMPNYDALERALAKQMEENQRVGAELANVYVSLGQTEREMEMLRSRNELLAEVLARSGHKATEAQPAIKDLGDARVRFSSLYESAQSTLSVVNQLFREVVQFGQAFRDFSKKHEEGS